MKKYIVTFLCFVLATGFIGMAGTRYISDCGIASAETIQDVNNMKCYLSVTNTKEQIEQDKKMLEEESEELFSGYDDADHIAIVIPTGKVKLYEIHVVQEVEVLEIKKGNAELTGKKIMVEDSGAGFQMGEKGKVPNCYSVQNIMQENTKYLCFFDDISLNKENNVEQYLLTGGLLCFFNLEHTNRTKLLPKEKTEYTFGDLVDVEFFCSSQEALDINNAIKEKMVQKYCQ